MIRREKVFRVSNMDTIKKIALLIQEASLFESFIYIYMGEKRANAKSLLGMMSLGIADGTAIVIECDGRDEEQAVEKLASFVEA